MAGDSRFFQCRGPFDLATVALHAEGESDPSQILLEGIAPLHEAKPTDITFLDNRRYLQTLADTRAGAVIVHPSLRAHVPSHTIAIRSAEPYAAWARVCLLFHPDVESVPGIHPTAFIDPLAIVDASASIGPLVVVKAGASIGCRARIEAGAIIQNGVVIGSDCVIGAGASLSHAILGSRVHIGPGCRIGQEGFGFASTESGFLAIPQLGRVLIEDDVRVGANTAVDRGSARDTIIGAGTWIDNLVQIAHNVTIGRHCIIVAQVGIAGSTQIGDFVRLGGQAAIAGHVEVGARASIGAQAGVIGNVPPGAKLLGSPAQPKRDFLKQMAKLRQTIKPRVA
ncbi:UDP-3-O-(3-hydroxymyristoyl)glucosamine N-acyltransferase (plasmid) [Rhizobium leguminosarum]|jgi:UDP-3-O-[3-hydroxymyristoyl] glucosamine N-acyltransferase